MSKSFKWVSFAYSDQDTKTAIHFFPFAGSISATYPVELVLSVFGADFETVQITMEGARLSQPDGIVLDQVFPALLSNYQGFYGVSLTLTCPQQGQLDLGNSICMTELISNKQILRFDAKAIHRSGGSEANAICRESADSIPALVAVNAAEIAYNTGLPAGLVKTDLRPENQLLPGSVRELTLSKDYLKSGVTQLTSDGEMNFNHFQVQAPSPQVLYFYIERHRAHNSLMHVQCL